MAVDDSPTPPPCKKRPRLRTPSATAEKPVSRFRPPSGRSLSNSQPTTTMQTFADLAGKGRSRAEQFLGEDAPEDVWATITNTMDNLGSSVVIPANPDASKSKLLSDAEAGGTADTMNFNLGARERSADRLLFDLSLKTKVHISSLNCLKWTLSRSQPAEYDALRRFVADEGDSVYDPANGKPVKTMYNPRRRGPFLFTDLPSEEEVLKAKQKLYEALLHFRCPSSPLPNRISADWQALTKDYGSVSRQNRPANDARKLMVDRLLEWQGALQSLFFGYRAGRVPMFYVVLSTTTVVFSSGFPWKTGKLTPDGMESIPDTSSSLKTCFRAGIAKASTGLRGLLQDSAVPFSVVDGTDGFDEPCAVVEGTHAVHMLYNFLLEWGHQISNAEDVPILIADKPFRGGTIVSAELFHAKESLVPIDGGRETYKKHTLQMRGIFTPRQVDEICQALAVVQEYTFEAHLEAEGRGTMLNACGHGAKDENEHHRLRGPVVLSRVRSSPEEAGISFSIKDA